MTPETEFSVRRFERGDGARVRELNEAAMAGTPEWVPEAPDADLDDVPGHYLDAGGEFLVGVRGGRIVATAAYEPLAGWMGAQFDQGGTGGADESVVELSRMRVAPDWQGQGIGTAVYEDLEGRAREAGVEGFVLNTGVANDRARGFYESRGFDHVRDERVELGDVTMDLALYRNRFADCGRGDPV